MTTPAPSMNGMQPGPVSHPEKSTWTPDDTQALHDVGESKAEAERAAILAALESAPGPSGILDAEVKAK
jgi:hypothetical protein